MAGSSSKISTYVFSKVSVQVGQAEKMASGFDARSASMFFFASFLPVSRSPMPIAGLPQQLCSCGKVTATPASCSTRTALTAESGKTKSMLQPVKKTTRIFGFCGLSFSSALARSRNGVSAMAGRLRLSVIFAKKSGRWRINLPLCIGFCAFAPILRSVWNTLRFVRMFWNTVFSANGMPFSFTFLERSSSMMSGMGILPGQICTHLRQPMQRSLNFEKSLRPLSKRPVRIAPIPPE